MSLLEAATKIEYTSESEDDNDFDSDDEQDDEEQNDEDDEEPTTPLFKCESIKEESKDEIELHSPPQIFENLEGDLDWVMCGNTLYIITCDVPFIN